MGNSKRSLIGHLTLTAWESWSAEPHWRNAVIIALVGSVAFSMSKPAPSGAGQTRASTTQNSTPQHSQNNAMPSSMSPNATVITPKSKLPPKLKPKISTDNVIIKETEKKDTKDNNFGRSYGDK